jgi:hypothetical protein
MSDLLKNLNKNFASLITTSLGVTAALSFNDAIKSLFQKGGAFESIGHHGVWYTAAFVTVLAFFATYLFTNRYPESSPTIKENPIKA